MKIGKEQTINAIAEIAIQQAPEDTLVVSLSGHWTLNRARPSVEKVRHFLDTFSELRIIKFDTQKLMDWDSGLLIFVKRLRTLSECWGDN